LFPHPGRIAEGKFTFEGNQYALPLADGHPNALHGFVHTRPWRVEHVDSQSVSAVFQASVDDPQILKWWPSDFCLWATYRLSGNSLDCDLRWRNTGSSPLPYGLGTHTYFRLPLARDASTEETVLTAPVSHQWKFVDMLATGELGEIPSDLSLSAGVPLGARKFDDMYRLDATGVATTTIADPSSGRRVVQHFSAADFPNLVIYTPGHREAVCMEPYSCAADPFRLEAMGIPSGLRVLQPGEEASTRITLAAEMG
jgi:aldose 1-epimerase